MSTPETKNDLQKFYKQTNGPFKLSLMIGEKFSTEIAENSTYDTALAVAKTVQCWNEMEDAEIVRLDVTNGKSEFIGVYGCQFEWHNTEKQKQTQKQKNLKNK